MTHPLIPQILEAAAPVATSLGLQLVGAVFQTNHNPPILRVDIRNLQHDTGLDDCEQMSRELEAVLDQSGILGEAYVLEISSPGVSKILSSDREFTSFKGFPVTVKAHSPYAGQTLWTGQLIRRDDTAVHLSLKGRAIAIPREFVALVELADAPA
jgi:ribosome maturation factor RimP